MRVIGITGGIGSGKSTVSKFLIELGYKVLDADKIAREIVEEGSPVLKRLEEAFGKDILEDGKLNRKALAAKAFSSKVNRDLLNKITHEEIKRSMKKQIQESEGVIFIDAALLFEAGVNEMTDENWLIYTPKEMRINRTIKRDNSTKKDVEKVMSFQLEEEEKAKMVDVIIENTSSIEELKSKVLKQLSEIKCSH